MRRRLVMFKSLWCCVLDWLKRERESRKKREPLSLCVFHSHHPSSLLAPKLSLAFL